MSDAGRADVGYWLLPEGRGRGCATRAVLLISEWAIRELGIVRLQLWAEPENVASLRVADRRGYQREGVLRSFEEVGGRRVDSVMFSLLPSDLAAPFANRFANPS